MTPLSRSLATQSVVFRTAVRNVVQGWPQPWVEPDLHLDTIPMQCVCKRKFENPGLNLGPLLSLRMECWLGSLQSGGWEGDWGAAGAAVLGI